MKLTLYNAITLDGFIAKDDGDTDWVRDADWEEFSEKVKNSKAIVMGRTTYEHSGDDFPYDCELNIVMTSVEDLLYKEKQENVLFSNLTPGLLVKEVADRGFNELLIIGGGKLNASFLKAGLIDEMIFSIHPLMFGNGIPVFDMGEEFDLNLELIESKELGEELIQVRYKVAK